ncbi:MAG: ATP-binding protein [Syntrophomonadaceae bacterium]|nr:ATP-binding protein [Syntrophomonadaceae bacterium]
MKRKIFWYMGILALGTALLAVAGAMAAEHVIAILGIPFVIIIMLLTVLLSLRLTDRLVEPLNDIEPETPLKNVAFEEIAPLLFKLHQQNEIMRYNTELLAKRQDEFKVITENMTEGLILMDGDMTILSANPSALRQLRAKPGDYSGMNLSALNDSAPLLEIVRSALGGTHRDRVITVSERNYQLLASPVRFGEYIVGCALLTLDVTEKHAAEKLRQEFSANVSHELKTPLTSISGYAEMLTMDMAEPQDVPVFAGKILDEAHHLLEVINDIIKISRLDEGRGEEEFLPVDLLDLARAVAERLRDTAELRDITISVAGQGGVVMGLEPFLREMVFNLCDNAVKYNRPGGFVLITVNPMEDDRVRLIVEDSGIGIPAAEQERVFERFYRGDKSHYRDIDDTGTGLGLAIVKHVARFHQATLQVTSEQGRGSRFEIIFKA